MNKIEKGPAFWKAFGQAAALWAAVAVAGSLLLPGGSHRVRQKKCWPAQISFRGTVTGGIPANKCRAAGNCIFAALTP